MSITTDDQSTQREPNDSAGTQHYPTTLYTPPVFNVGDPESPGHRMLHTDLQYLYECVRDGDSERAPDPELIERLRELAPHKGEKVPGGKPTAKAIEYETIKKHQLPFSVPGHYQPGHRHSPDPQKPSGNPERATHADRFIECQQHGAHAPIRFASYRFIELDNLDADKLAAERDRLKAHPSVIAVWLSAGGSGLHIFARLDTAPSNNAEAHVAYEVVVHELGIADSVANDVSVKNLARLAFVSHDTDAWWNPNPAPLVWKMPGSEAQNRGQDRSGKSKTHQSHEDGRKSTERGDKNSEAGKSSWACPDAEPGGTGSGFGSDASKDLVNRALEAMIAGRAGENDAHLLAVMGNLKTLGWTFEAFDRWAATAGCTCDRRPRWDNPPRGHQSDTPGWAIVNLAKKQYGFRFRSGTKTGTGTGYHTGTSSKANDRDGADQEHGGKADGVDAATGARAACLPARVNRCSCSRSLAVSSMVYRFPVMAATPPRNSKLQPAEDTMPP